MPERIIQNLENQRAEFALECVKKAGQKNFRTEYKSHVKKIPVLIKTNGLGNTLAYVLSKRSNSKAYDLIYQQLSKWLHKPEISCEVLPAQADLLTFVVAQPTSIYRQITTETLALLTWFKRLADGMIEGEDNG